MKHTFYFIITIITILCLYNGCGDKSPIECCGTNTVDTNILRTDEFGNILGGDTTDWCMDTTTGAFRFGPAYPNPTNLTVSINFYLPQNDTITLSIRNSLGGGDSVLFQGPLPAGTHGRNINGANYLNSFQRLCISSKHYSPGTGCNFCGDIKFVQ